MAADHQQATLSAGISKLNLQMSNDAQQTLLAFLSMLQKWNRHYNLTAITKLSEMLTHHVLDSLAVAPFIKGGHILDVGTGAGFPGVVLALYYPDKQFTLLDSNGKKVRFLIQAIAELELSNVKAVQARAEGYESSQCFDTITSRAVGSLDMLIKNTQHLACADGRLLMMKGAYPSAELQHLTHRVQVHKLEVPNLNAERHVVIFDKGVESGQDYSHSQSERRRG